MFVFFIVLVILAYLIVFKVSDRLRRVGLTLATIVVMEFDPKLSLSSLVKLQLLKLIEETLLASARSRMTIPRFIREVFISDASVSLSPVEPVLPTLSLPARSTRFSLPTV